MSSLSPVITVSQLNRLARLALEKALPSCWISGEISNFTQATSGHVYFTLKDHQSAVRCAFFRNRNQFMDRLPMEGDKVEVRAQATLYEARGEFQLLIDAMRKDGQGHLYEEFVQLKLKLEAEGMFKEVHKSPLPIFPKSLGIVTSLQAAALQDVLKTLQLRWPLCTVIIYPASVQGSDSVETIMLSLNNAIARDECDVLLLVRGGGSLEDLRAFNDEKLARTLFECPIPVITGIGHETDFSIADFVADVRAATPTAAAQLSVPDSQESKKHVLDLTSLINRAQVRRIYLQMQELDGWTRRIMPPGKSILSAMTNVKQLQRRIHHASTVLLSRTLQNQNSLLNRFRSVTPETSIHMDRIRNIRHTLSRTMNQAIAKDSIAVSGLLDSLQQLNPENVLARGYCLTLSESGTIIKDLTSVHDGDRIKVAFKSGIIGACVEYVSSNPERAMFKSGT